MDGNKVKDIIFKLSVQLRHFPHDEEDGRKPSQETISQRPSEGRKCARGEWLRGT